MIKDLHTATNSKNIDLRGENQQDPSPSSNPKPQALVIRWGWVLVALGISITIAIGSLFVIWRSPLFKIKKLEVEGSRSLSSEEVIGFSKIRVGENLLMVDLTQAGAHLLRHPRIEDVSFRRRYPNGLKIRIEEAKTIALFKSDKLYEVNSAGWILPALAKESDYHLPMLMGIDPGGDTASIVRRVFLGAMILKNARRWGIQEMVEVVEVDLSDSDYPVLVTAGRSRIILAAERVEEGLIYLHSILVDLAESDRRFAYVDLRYQGSGVIGR